MRTFLFLAALITVSSTSLATADPLTVERFLRDYGKHESFDYPYLLGITQGLEVANDELIEHKQSRMFCIPSKLAFTGEQSRDILKRFVERYPPMEKALVPVAMLEALKEAFPCEK
jgi:outer membrane protein assembly factor BamD (BamD/ComL family)